MHGVLLDVAKFPPKGGVISFSPFLSLTLVPAAAMPIYPWPPLDRGIPVKSASTLLYLRGAWAGQGEGGLKYLLTFPHSSPSFPSWILFDEKNFEGEQHILSEGEFPTLTAMGCLASTVLGSLQKVPLVSALLQFQAPLRQGLLLGEPTHRASSPC